jgi:hypothetical protein
MLAMSLFVRPIRIIQIVSMNSNLTSKYMSTRSVPTASLAPVVDKIQNKRNIWKKKTSGIKTRQQMKNTLKVVAYSTADYYDLRVLKKAFFDEGV